MKINEILLDKFIPRPYKLYNKIQNYDWGTRNNDAFIPNFLGIEPVPDLPYAELWIGAHPKAPSEIEVEGTKIPLNKIIELHTRECLGEYTSKMFAGNFPFLLKVLSAAKALSIQAHPNKLQAEKLHAKDPVNYPDDNHKPEIAIALDSLAAVAGFRPINEIRNNLRSLPELYEFVGSEIINDIINSSEEAGTEDLIKKLYSKILRASDEKVNLGICINKITERLTQKKDLSTEESEFLKQHELFGTDIGLLSFFFFNFIHLKSGQAIFTKAGVPHAYIKGNIIECMANSDNVVRAGLTNKFKDVETLLEILRYEFKQYDIFNSEQNNDDVTFKTAACEFEVSVNNKDRAFESICESNDKPWIYLITNGSLNVKWKNDGKEYVQNFSRGESFLVPAFLSNYIISSDLAVQYFTATVPIKE